MFKEAHTISYIQQDEAKVLQRFKVAREPLVKALVLKTLRTMANPLSQYFIS
jgi:hypothetical protein